MLQVPIVPPRCYQEDACDEDDGDPQFYSHFEPLHHFIITRRLLLVMEILSLRGDRRPMANQLRDGRMMELLRDGGSRFPQ